MDNHGMTAMPEQDPGISLAEIVSLAERESGGFGLASEGLLSRIGILVKWINDRGPYSRPERRAMQAQMQRLLATRLKLLTDRARYPGIAAETISRPIFIIGFARSGTTLLHSLLAEDPDVLSPQAWHMYSPSPPPGSGPIASERIACAQRQVERWMDFCPAQKPMHPYIDQGAFQLIEDEEVFALDFRYCYPYHFYEIPTLDAPISLPFDPIGAMQFHREFLQHLQWNTGKRRWVCKGPTHQGNLAGIFEAYPDALCIWPHRPIGEIFASIVTLNAAIFDTIAGKPGDIRRTAESVAGVLRGAFDQLLADDLIDDPRILHLPFDQIVADPMAAIAGIYDRLQLAVEPMFSERVSTWLASPANQVDRYGRYPYSYEVLGIEQAEIENMFADYSQRFGLS